MLLSDTRFNPNRRAMNSACMSSLRLKQTKVTSRKLCAVSPFGKCCSANDGDATATYSIAPSGMTLQPRSACLSVVTHPST